MEKAQSLEWESLQFAYRWDTYYRHRSYLLLRCKMICTSYKADCSHSFFWWVWALAAEQCSLDCHGLHEGGLGPRTGESYSLVTLRRPHWVKQICCQTCLCTVTASIVHWLAEQNIHKFISVRWTAACCVSYCRYLAAPGWEQLRAAWSYSSFIFRAGTLPAHGRIAAAHGPGALTVTFCVAVMAYMQFVEDYSEPQPSMFYQTPQNEHIYQQKNKHLMEVYGFNDSFISLDPSQDLAPPPALPPKQRQLVSDTTVPFPAPPGAALCLLLLFLTGCGCGRGSHWCSRCIPCHLIKCFQAFCIVYFEFFCSFLTLRSDSSPKNETSSSTWHSWICARLETHVMSVTLKILTHWAAWFWRSCCSVVPNVVLQLLSRMPLIITIQT